ncbi:MAG: DegV family protein [Clostridiales bacterium]|nr:DegV family protein [Clostridiales bacterium]
MKNNFAIVTDSGANLTDGLIDRYELEVLSLVYIVDGAEMPGYVKGEKTDLKHYYDLMRKKIAMSTSCVNKGDCEKLFEQLLGEGRDVLYIGFSSGLSATYQVAAEVLTGMKEKYPDRKIFSVDSLSASLGEGRLVTFAAEMREDGHDIENVRNWVEANKLKLCHLFTVETLSYLYRGGRVAKSAYMLAGALNIKPIMHVDDNGKLTSISKAIGRKGSISALATKTANSIVNPEIQTIYISHGDCIEDVDYFIEKLKEKICVKEIVVNYVDLVVGAHSGPGTLAVFFMGESRSRVVAESQTVTRPELVRAMKTSKAGE